MKVVVSDPKTGKTYQGEIAKGSEGTVVGVKIGDTIDGAIVGAAGYKLQVTGGSDSDGVPMRGDVAGGRKIYAVLSGGTGVRVHEKGERRRKPLRGNVITTEIAQVNTKVVEAGEKPLAEIFPAGKKEDKK